MKNFVKKIATGVTLGLIVAVAVASPAHAYDRGRPDRDWRGHEYRAHHDWHGPHGPGPGVVYAPPVVYSPPPPVSPGINLILPLNFR
jgi:hypothetical protein